MKTCRMLYNLILKLRLVFLKRFSTITSLQTQSFSFHGFFLSTTNISIAFRICSQNISPFIPIYTCSFLMLQNLSCCQPRTSVGSFIILEEVVIMLYLIRNILKCIRCYPTPLFSLYSSSSLT